MKIDKFAKIKQSKPFEIGDVFVYFALFLALLFLFIFFVIVPSTTVSNGFNIFIDGNKVAVYHYGSNKVDICNDNYLNLINYDATKKTITVYSDSNKTAYNVIAVDDANKTAKIIDANCSTSKDCVSTPSLGVAIVCAPHKLKITPIGDGGFTPPVTGGA